MNIQNSLEKFDLNNLFDSHDIHSSRFDKVKLNQYVIYSSDYEDIIDRQEEVRFWVLLGNDITRNCCVGKLVGINMTLPPPFSIKTVDGEIIECEYIYFLGIEDNKNESTSNEKDIKLKFYSYIATKTMGDDILYWNNFLQEFVSEKSFNKDCLLEEGFYQKILNTYKDVAITKVKCDVSQDTINFN